MRKAFTLVELMTIIVIVVVLVIILVGQIVSDKNKKVSPPGPDLIAPNVYEFHTKAGESDGEEFSSNLGQFIGSHQNLRIRSIAGVDFTYHGQPKNYIVVFEER